jgi:hypothetical protein
MILWRVAGVPNEGRSARGFQVRRDDRGRFSHAPLAVTLSNQNGPSCSRLSSHPSPAARGRHNPTVLARKANPSQPRPVGE